jgi:hypothetical protein
MATQRQRTRKPKPPKPPKVERKKVVSVKKARPILDGSIDAGLFLLFLATPPGIERSAEEIAFVCGCDPSRIGQIQAAAIKKIRNSPLAVRLREHVAA